MVSAPRPAPPVSADPAAQPPLLRRHPGAILAVPRPLAARRAPVSEPAPSPTAWRLSSTRPDPRSRRTDPNAGQARAGAIYNLSPAHFLPRHLLPVTSRGPPPRIRLPTYFLSSQPLCPEAPERGWRRWGVGGQVRAGGDAPHAASERAGPGQVQILIRGRLRPSPRAWETSPEGISGCRRCGARGSSGSASRSGEVDASRCWGRARSWQREAQVRRCFPTPTQPSTQRKAP